MKNLAGDMTIGSRVIGPTHIPFVIAEIFVLTLLVAFPVIATWLPELSRIGG